MTGELEEELFRTFENQGRGRNHIDKEQQHLSRDMAPKLETRH